MRFGFFAPWYLRFRMGRAYVRGDLSSAVKYAERCLRRDKGDTSALWTISECYLQKSNYVKAIEYAGRAFSIDPENFNTLQLLVEVYFRQEDYNSTYRYIVEAIKVAQKMDAALGPYIEKLLTTLSSSWLDYHPTRVFRRSIIEDREEEKEWLEWAIAFKAWYEASNEEETEGEKGPAR